MDRWLEHSRVYSFGEGEDQRIFIGSGDLLNRNLERRVETLIEVVTPDTREQINTVLDALRNDREKSRIMKSDGSYVLEKCGKGTGSQEALYQYFSPRKVKLDDAPAEPAERKNGMSQSGRRRTGIRAAADRDKPHGNSIGQNPPAGIEP